MSTVFYGALAEWWPLISPVEDSAEEAAEAARVLGTAAIPVREVLELGSGGGHTAAHLKAQFTMTLVDLSADMLAVSRRLNPEAVHAQGDMRTVRLGRQFDAVFVHDAIDYMTTEPDLVEALATAHAHCRPGGIVALLPDCTAETFVAGSDHGGTDTSDGRGVRYLEWSWDPDPRDTWVLTEYGFLVRDADGSVSSAHETHRHGLFAHATWLRLLEAAGFESEAVEERHTEERAPRQFFVGHRPTA